MNQNKVSNLFRANTENKKLIQFQKSGVFKDPKKAYQRAGIELVTYKD